MKLIVVLYGVVAFLGFFNSANAESNNKLQNNKNYILEQWKDMDKTFTRMTGSAIKMILPQMMEIVNDLNISSTCVKQSMQLISGIRRLKIWAFRFVDSSTKIMDGIFSGTFTSVGVYHQCLESAAPSKDPNVPAFRGKYCQIDLKPPLPQKYKNYRFGEKIDELLNFTGSEILNFMAERAGMMHSFPYRISLCVPEGCSSDDIYKLVQAIADRNYLTSSINYCAVKEEETKYSPIMIFAIVSTSILFLLVIFGTLFEYWFVSDEITFESFGIKLLLSFSAISNFKRLFSIKTSDKSIRSLYGIQYLGITMLVMGHSYLYPLYMMHMYQSLTYVYDMMKKPMGQMIMNSHVTLDTFFFLGGFLQCYIAMKRINIDKKNYNVLVFLLHRLWRIAPVYYFIILVSILTPLMGSGPNFRDAMKFSVNNCQSYWWANVLFINNFFKMENMCMVHTWFISCEMQLYILALIIIFTLSRSQTTGIAITILLIIISMVYTGTITFLYDLVPGIYMVYLDKDFLGDTFMKTFANPLTHAGPYFIGVLIAYIIVMSSEITVSKKFQIIGWLVAALCGGYSLFWTALWNHYTPSSLETSIYAGLYRNTWAIGVAWMTFCCVTGNGGFINKFLSWGPWIPLAKLSFLIYLIQPTMQTMYIAVFKSTQEYNHFQMITIYFGMLMMSGILALVLNLLIQNPIIAIEKLFVGESTTTVLDPADKIVQNGKHTNGDLPVENKNGLELNDFSGYVDNKAYDPTA